MKKIKAILWTVVLFIPAILLELFSAAKCDWDSPWWKYKQDVKDAFNPQPIETKK